MSKTIIADLSYDLSILEPVEGDNLDQLNGGIFSLMFIAFSAGYGIGTLIRNACQ